MTFKAQFCVRGSKQLKEIDFFKTYALVVLWTTMANIHLGDFPRLKSKQGNVLFAFLHVDLEPGENVYVEMPLGFLQ
jgi:hypothetical protein